jgi:hypothetical protein
VNKRIGSYPRVRVRDDGGGVVSQAGGVLDTERVYLLLTENPALQYSRALGTGGLAC